MPPIDPKLVKKIIEAVAKIVERNQGQAFYNQNSVGKCSCSFSFVFPDICNIASA